MKFLGGFITGVAGTILALFLIYSVSESDDTLTGLTMFSEKGECITKNNLKIFQTVKPNMALAEFGKYPNKILVLLLNYENKSYYDEQKIPIPTGKCARQIGTYQYRTKMEVLKTVPVVVIE
ncbi:hypothetical protein G5B30_04330 [Sphingobacterium sp. SGG-5]|uniref:hypothetical protein n=1 Tax=Sphingobacterium sp. SGG-5 TaxID=2710881 RepID=UPI0013EA9BA0|nr:hypothetical protein [Sphingobacterium sp. SGG-5]NGM61142.1 hypothetical protein [Sphingobacterium sp. SGG-5]